MHQNSPDNNTKKNYSISRFFTFNKTYYSISDKIWNSNIPPKSLIITNIIIALLMAIPISYVFFRAFQGNIDKWKMVFSVRFPKLILSTLSLMIAVTIITIVIGTLSAWLINRTDLPGRRFWRLTTALPLVIPPYVGALSYIIVFGPTGWIKDIIGKKLFDIYGFWGVAFVMAMFTFPYVYMIVSSAIQNIATSYEEAALSCGLSYKKIFFKVILPMLRPAIVAGSLLVSLYILADFGAIALMRYKTFASAIYFQIKGTFDRSGAAILSVILIIIMMIILWVENYLKKKYSFTQSVKSIRKAKMIKLGRWKIPALIFICFVFLASVGIPVFVLTYWSIKGILNGALNSRFFGFVWNSFYSASIAALVCMILAIPTIYLKSRHKSKISLILNRIIYSGYVLPGVIIALGIVFVFNRYIPWLYGTSFMVIFAYILRYLPKTMQSVESSMDLIPHTLDEASKSLGKGTFETILKVILPISLPGILSGGALAFVSMLKELPATLLLRPPGFDTLAVRIWLESSEGFYELAAPSALLLIIISIIPLKIMLKNH